MRIRKHTTDEENPIEQVKVYFMRHGFSCANAATRFSNHFASAATTLLNKDPPLTQWGQMQNREDAHLIHLLNEIQPDAVLCSPLLRAIETAYWSTRGTSYKGKIYVIPYVGETPSAIPTNNPRSIARQKEKLKKLGINVNKIDYTYVMPKTTHADGYSNPSYRKFMNFLESNLFTFNKQKRTPTLNLIVVSHGSFLNRSLRYCQQVKGGCSIKNNSVILQIFKTKKDSQLLGHPVMGKVEFKGLRYEGDPSLIGIERCSI